MVGDQQETEIPVRAASRKGIQCKKNPPQLNTKSMHCGDLL